MNFVDSIEIGGVHAFQIPSIKGKGSPTTATEGDVGCFYMDTDTGNMYKCTAAANGEYTWEVFGGGGSAAETDEKYFDIDDNGIVSLKPEYRGTGNSSYIYSISDNGEGTNGTKIAELPAVLVIPEIVNEIAVTALAEAMFWGNTAVKSITIPSYITEIPAYFCREAKKLEEIKGTERVEVIGKTAFGISAIRKANFPNLKNLGNTAFYYCVYLVAADIGNTITEVSQGAFYGCENLSSIRGGNAITSVASNGLLKTQRLKNLSFASNLENIGNHGIYMSRVNYDWHSHTDCTYGTLSTPKQLNPTDFWTGKTFTPCEIPLRSTFNQDNPAWDEDVDNEGNVYRHDCGPCTLATIYSAYEGEDIVSPAEFMKVVETVNPDAMAGINTNAGEKACMEAVGYEATWYDTDANLQVLYDSLAAGHLVAIRINDGKGGITHIVVAYGVNSSGEIMVVDSDTLFKEFGDYRAATYAMPIQNLLKAVTGTTENGFMVVKKS